MADIVVANTKKGKRRGGQHSSVREKLLRTSDGRFVKVLSLDANSASFADDLTVVFARNVARARRENKKLFGSASGFRANKK
jgi:hypothetical protein